MPWYHVVIYDSHSGKALVDDEYDVKTERDAVDRVVAKYENSLSDQGYPDISISVTEIVFN